MTPFPRDDASIIDNINSSDEIDDDHKPRSKRKFALFNESGLTEADRRLIRRKQRTIQKTLLEGDVENLDNIRNSNNKIFKDKVCYTREAVLDADNIELITEGYAKKLEATIQVPRFDAHTLVQKLTQKCTNKSSTSQYFDWRVLGHEAGVCFNALPEQVGFLAGALDHEVKEKKKPERAVRQKRQVDDEAEEIKPENVQNNTTDADKLSAMEKNMRTLKKKLGERTKEEMEKNPNAQYHEHPDLDSIQFLFNPKSFTQTVENIFNFSFLIKKGEAEIGVRKGGLVDGKKKPGLFIAKRSNDLSEGTTATQAVCSFTIRDWKRLCEATQLQQGDLPHRTGSKQKRHSTQSQQVETQ